MSQAGSLPNEASQELVPGRLLDGFLLLAAGGSSTPDDVVSANLSSLRVIDVAEEDLSFFTNLDRVDLSDNQLNYDQVLEHLGRLPRVGSIVLACNSISYLTVPTGSLRSLHTLDLSYNELRGDVLSHLACLQSLVTLNLASNCISSLPSEEELYGLQCLQELILDANDLVQFVQWRALDAIPNLKKLSLASNRVKRLKDDAPDSANGVVTYFPMLQELDLSSNEIVGVECLPAVKLFLSLKTLRLSDNPCTRVAPSRQLLIPGIDISSQESKPWYLKFSGCHQIVKQKKIKLKMDSRTMRKVPNERQDIQARLTGPLQLSSFDEEANQLLISLSFRSEPPGATIRETGPSTSFLTAVDERPPATVFVEKPIEILNDDLTEEELDQILRERRAHIERQFKATPQEPPASFMRKPPFGEGSSSKQKLQMLMSSKEDGGPAHSTDAEPGRKRTSSYKERSSSFQSGALAYDAQRNHPDVSLRRNQPVSILSTSHIADTGLLGPMAPMAPMAYGGYSNLVVPTFDSPASRFTATPGAKSSLVGLPPISGSKALSDEHGAGRDSLTKSGKAPDMGVREAMRALRAAAMSEFAASRVKVH